MTMPDTRDYGQAEDTQLVLWARNDPEAFGVLYRRYITNIYKYVYYRTNIHHDAEDLTARVFYRAMAHIDSYTDRGIPFSAWLYRIAHNLVANWHRDRGRRQIISLEDYVGDGLRGEAPEHQVVTLEEKHALMEAIKRLPEERQQLIILKYVERMSNAEIGTIMDRTEGAVKSLYHRTLLALRRELSSDSDDHEDSSNEESETPPPRWRRFG